MEQAEWQEFEESMTRMWAEDDRRRLPERPASLGDGLGMGIVRSRRRSRSPRLTTPTTQDERGWDQNLERIGRGTSGNLARLLVRVRRTLEGKPGLGLGLVIVASEVGRRSAF